MDHIQGYKDEFVISIETEHELVKCAFNMTYAFSSSDLISILNEVF